MNRSLFLLALQVEKSKIKVPDHGKDLFEVSSDRKTSMLRSEAIEQTLFVVLGIKPIVSHLLSKHSTTELHSQLSVNPFYLFICLFVNFHFGEGSCIALTGPKLSL